MQNPEQQIKSRIIRNFSCHLMREVRNSKKREKSRLNRKKVSTLDIKIKRSGIGIYGIQLYSSQLWATISVNCISNSQNVVLPVALSVGNGLMDRFLKTFNKPSKILKLSYTL